MDLYNKEFVFGNVIQLYLYKDKMLIVHNVTKTKLNIIMEILVA